jgi:hypothetical protein
MGNSTNLAVVDTRLRLQELFDAVAGSLRAVPLPPDRSTATADRSGAFAAERPGERAKSASVTGRERGGPRPQPCRREAENFPLAPRGGRLHHFRGADNARKVAQPQLSHAAMRDLR